MPLSLSAMLALFNDNTAGDISAQDGRDVITALFDWIPPTEKYKRGRLAGETSHAADDFFSSYSGYTEVDPTGTTTFSATRGGLACKFDDHNNGDFSAAVKAVPGAGVPITIETAISLIAPSADNPASGLIFTDGTAGSSNLAAFGFMSDSASGSRWRPIMSTGTLESVTSGFAGIGAVSDGILASTVFIRLIWKSANTFAWAISLDSEVWTDFANSDTSTTFTPTHMGFYVSTWGVTVPCTALFSYLRVYEADLSV